MVTFIVIILVLINAIFITFFLVFPVFFAIIFRLESPFLFILCLSAEPCFCLTHLAEFFVACFFVVFKDLVLLIFLVLVLKFLNNGFSLFLSLAIFKIVCVKFVF